LMLGFWVSWVTNKQEKLAQTTTLQYKLDKEARTKFLAVQNSFKMLVNSEAVWRVVSRETSWDWKRNAGATSLIKRRRIKVGYMLPPFIQTRIKVPYLSLGKTQLFFLPDQVFVFQDKRYGAIDYVSLNVDFVPTRFIEDEGVPRDAQIIDYAWRYIRKDGGPDRRFNNNYQIPVVRYGYIGLFSKTGFKQQFHISNLAYAQNFSQTLSDYIKYSQNIHANTFTSKSSRNFNKTRAKKTKHEKTVFSREENAYITLGVSHNASWEEISSAYRKMAKMYHPDKVAGLAPEYQEIADKRMKEINSAYKLFRQKFGK